MIESFILAYTGQNSSWERNERKLPFFGQCSFDHCAQIESIFTRMNIIFCISQFSLLFFVYCFDFVKSKESKSFFMLFKLIHFVEFWNVLHLYETSRKKADDFCCTVAHKTTNFFCYCLFSNQTSEDHSSKRCTSWKVNKAKREREREERPSNKMDANVSYFFFLNSLLLFRFKKRRNKCKFRLNSFGLVSETRIICSSLLFDKWAREQWKWIQFLCMDKFIRRRRVHKQWEKWQNYCEICSSWFLSFFFPFFLTSNIWHCVHAELKRHRNIYCHFGPPMEWSTDFFFLLFRCRDVVCRHRRVMKNEMIQKWEK